MAFTPKKPYRPIVATSVVAPSVSSP